MLSASASVRPPLDPRVSASITLVAVLAIAVPALLWARGAASMPQAVTGRADTVAPQRSVKIVGAKPRSDNCAEQVWPYIEPRCLARAPSPSRTTNEARGTTDAAPATTAENPAAAAPPDASAQVVPRRVATALLPLPPRRAGRAETDGLAVPPGAVAPGVVAPGAVPPGGSTDRSASRTVDDARSDGTAEPWVGEPRRRAGRRPYRSRHHGRSVIILPY